MITRLPFREKDRKKTRNEPNQTKPKQNKGTKQEKLRMEKNDCGVFFMELVFQYQHQPKDLLFKRE